MRNIRGICKKLLVLAAVLLCVLCTAGTIQASAASTNVVASAKTVTGGKWEGKKYRLSNGRYAKNTWLKIDGSIYRFNSKGNRVTGWITYKNAKYYAASNGKVYVKKWLKKSGKYYYFLSNGKLAKSRMISSGGKYYYVNKSGVRVKSTWITYKKKRYYFNKSGVRLQSTWLKYKGKYYYLGADGAKAVNQWVGSYYVGSNGARKTNCFVDGYYLDANGKKTVKKFNGKYIFVGDSRTLEMKSVIAPADTLYIAKVSSGYSWLESSAGPLLKEYLYLNPNVKVVLAFGVNDLGNIQSYITYYRSLIKEYPKTKFYVLSVNPVDEKKGKENGYTVKNSQIVAFDKKLRTAFGTSVYINSYKYIKSRGVDTRDGIHYESQVYIDLYNFITGKIG